MGSTIFWIILGIVVFILDIATSSFLFIWFSIGAFVAMIASLMGASIGVQIILFLAISIITISIGYPWARKKFKSSVQRLPLMEEHYIGKVLKAEEDIEERGKAKLGGVYWAVLNKGETIKKGESFRIVEFEGNKLRIEKEEE
ncbi:NfeD family protein [Clostridium gasigenes]|uniref:Membrane protein implicated in regulation of membrane protease activity n=1 Tax=Clostridium gasigenes TaxID=94869 RepID=A0A1H0VF06_9CLOT|nr:NfeD family protein [Clostridium gasigenes]MBB6624841.1 NfeD family protein [Clostridium gasigenes]MBB6714758.1 NfeD family protein [Clostridium gasigenes]MBU3089845.1 NfeD family protein [Clostridium gasigenes]MBU3105169.1 NfeD family protein [Clostridium gasigenes]MBU3107589.1 NfeD family protein [Clostridium gasigenes]